VYCTDATDLPFGASRFYLGRQQRPMRPEDASRGDARARSRALREADSDVVEGAAIPDRTRI
jgi:hypothetical protein